MTLQEVQAQINLFDWERWELHDWYHTFNQLYEHRVLLFLAWCKNIDHLENNVRYSSTNSDWSKRPWWFVAGIGDEVSYHIPIKYRELAWRIIRNKLDKWLRDWHNSQDVVSTIFNNYL